MGKTTEVLCRLNGDLKYCNLPLTTGEESSVGWVAGELDILRVVNQEDQDLEFHCVLKCNKRGVLVSQTLFSSDTLDKIIPNASNPSRCTIRLKNPRRGYLTINKANFSDLQLLINVVEEIKRTTGKRVSSKNNTATRTASTNSEENSTPAQKQSIETTMKKSTKRKSKSTPKPTHSTGSGQGLAKKPCREPLSDVKNISSSEKTSTSKAPLGDADSKDNNPPQEPTIDEMRASQYKHLSTIADCLWNEALSKKNHSAHTHPSYKWGLVDGHYVQIGKPYTCTCDQDWGSDVWTLYGPPDIKKFKDYNDIIKKPMDFGTVRGNLLGERYDNPSECLADINQVFTNCYLYNHEETVIKARQLEKTFLRLKAKMPYGNVNLEQRSSDMSEKTAPSCLDSKLPQTKTSSGKSTPSTSTKSGNTPNSGIKGVMSSKATSSPVNPAPSSNSTKASSAKSTPSTLTKSGNTPKAGIREVSSNKATNHSVNTTSSNTTCSTKSSSGKSTPQTLTKSANAPNSGNKEMLINKTTSLSVNSDSLKATVNQICSVLDKINAQFSGNSGVQNSQDVHNQSSSAMKSNTLNGKNPNAKPLGTSNEATYVTSSKASANPSTAVKSSTSIHGISASQKIPAGNLATNTTSATSSRPSANSSSSVESNTSSVSQRPSDSVVNARTQNQTSETAASCSGIGITKVNPPQKQDVMESKKVACPCNSCLGRAMFHKRTVQTHRQKYGQDGTVRTYINAAGSPTTIYQELPKKPSKPISALQLYFQLPKKPSQPITAFQLFFQRELKKARRNNPSQKNVPEMRQMTKQKWERLPDAEREIQEHHYAVKKTRYDEAMKAYYNSPAYKEYENYADAQPVVEVLPYDDTVLEVPYDDMPVLEVQYDDTVVEVLHDAVVEVIPDAVVEVIPDAVVEVIPDAVVEVIPDAVVEVIPDAVVEVTPDPVVEVLPYDTPLVTTEDTVVTRDTVAQQTNSASCSSSTVLQPSTSGNSESNQTGVNRKAAETVTAPKSITAPDQAAASITAPESISAPYPAAASITAPESITAHDPAAASLSKIVRPPDKVIVDKENNDLPDSPLPVIDYGQNEKAKTENGGLRINIYSQYYSGDEVYNGKPCMELAVKFIPARVHTDSFKQILTGAVPKLFKNVTIELEDSSGPVKYKWTKDRTSREPKDIAGFRLERRLDNSDLNVFCRICLYPDHQPPCFRVPTELTRVLGIHTESLPAIIKAMWNYINAHNLRDEEEPEYINNDQVFRTVFRVRRMLVSEIPTCVRRVLLKPEPIILHHNINKRANRMENSFIINIEMVNGRVTVCPEPWLSPQGLEESCYDYFDKRDWNGIVRIPICKEAVANSTSTTSSATRSATSIISSLPTQTSTTQAVSVSKSSHLRSESTNLAPTETMSSSTVSSASSQQCPTQESDQRYLSTNSAYKKTSSVSTTNSALRIQASTSQAVPASHTNQRTMTTNSSSTKALSATTSYSNLPSSTIINPARLSSSSGGQTSSRNPVPNQRRSSAPSTISSPTSMTTSDNETSDSSSDIVEVTTQSLTSNSSDHHIGNSTDDCQPTTSRARKSADLAEPPSSSCSPTVTAIHSSLSKPKSPDHLLEAFKEELSCAICTQELQDPKDLDCCHTFCKGCLQKWLDSQSRKTAIPCPICLKDTDLKDSGVEGLKTSHVIKTLVDQVRSAMVGSTINSLCKIHGWEGMIVNINCKTCEQFVCYRCMDVCQRLDHVIEGQPGQFSGGPPGRMLHPLSGKKQACLTRIQENSKRQKSFDTQVEQIRRMVTSYGQKLKEKIQRDMEKKIEEINKVEKEGEGAFAAYAKDMEEFLKEVDGAIDNQSKTSASNLTGHQPQQGNHYGPGQHSNMPQQAWPHPGPPPVGHPMPIPVGPAPVWPYLYGNGNQGFPAPWQSWNPYVPPPQPSTRQQATSLGNSQRQADARQNHQDAVSKERREAEVELYKVLRKPIPSLPPNRMLTFVASGHHLQECPVGQVVCQWW